MIIELRTRIPEAGGWFNITELTITPSHQQNTHDFADGRKNMNVIFHTHVCSTSHMCLGPWFNIKMSSYQYRNSHCGDKTILRPSYLHNGISYTGEMTSLYWIRAQDANFKMSNVSPDIKMSSYHYRKSHCGDKTILRPSPQWDFLYWWDVIFILNQDPGIYGMDT